MPYTRRAAAVVQSSLMESNIILIEQKKNIALVAHDSKKQDLLEWARWNKALLAEHELYATGTTGMLLEQVLERSVHRFQSGPLGGDQQIGAKIAEGEIDFMIFFWDPLDAAPHDPDVKALLRIAVVWNIPVACNRASADFMISSTLMTGEYARHIPDYQPYTQRYSPGAAPTDDRPVEVVVVAEEDATPEDGATADAETTPEPEVDVVETRVLELQLETAPLV
jgi:methylglyoxal synthase